MLQNIITEMKIARDLGDAQNMYHIYKRHILPFLRKQVKNLNEETETKPNTQCDCKTKPECYVKGCIKTG